MSSSDQSLPPLPPPKHYSISPLSRSPKLRSDSAFPLPALPVDVPPPPRHPSTIKLKPPPSPVSPVTLTTVEPIAPTPILDEQEARQEAVTETVQSVQVRPPNGSAGSAQESPPATPAYEWREHDLESLADQIASAVDPSRASSMDDVGGDSSIEPSEEEEVGIIGGYASLRRRFTTRSADKGKQREELESPAKTENRALQAALEELEDIEVADFLERVGKQVQEVRVAIPAHEMVLPSQEDYRTPEGNIDWVSFAIAYFTATATIYTPASLIAGPPPTRFSLTQGKNHLERLYVLCPPPLWNAILHGAFADVYRWKSPNTWKWCLLYSIFWLFDLVPMLPFAIFLFFLLQKRLYPPTPAEILAQSRARAIRAEEASELSKQMKSTTKISFAVESAKDAISGLVPSSAKSEATSLMRGLQGSALLGGIVGGAAGVKVDFNGAQESKSKAKPPREINPGGALARGLGAATIAGGVAVPNGVTIEGLKPIPPPSSKEEVDFRAPDGSVSLYSLAKELLHVFGPTLQEYMAQGSDLGEKIKNLFLHSDHPSVPLVCLRLAAICVFIILCPAWLLIKGCWAYLGVEFFFLWRLRELNPKWRRALVPYWWVIYDAPTDADYATYILQKRSRAHKALRGSKTIKRQAKARAHGMNGVEQPQVASIDPGTSALGGSSLAAMGLGAGITNSPSVHNQEPIVGTYFALFHATPGNLILSSTKIRFAPTRGFRTLGLKLVRPVYTGVPDTASVTLLSSLERDDNDGHTFMFDLLTSEIASVKKEKLLRFEGLQIETRDGQVYRLANVAKRDIAFNQLVAIAPLIQ